MISGLMAGGASIGSMASEALALAAAEGDGVGDGFEAEGFGRAAEPFAGVIDNPVSALAFESPFGALTLTLTLGGGGIIELLLPLPTPLPFDRKFRPEPEVGVAVPEGRGRSMPPAGRASAEVLSPLPVRTLLALGLEP